MDDGKRRVLGEFMATFDRKSKKANVSSAATAVPFPTGMLLPSDRNPSGKVCYEAAYRICKVSTKRTCGTFSAPLLAG